MNGKFGGGNGTSSNPFLIEDADDLNAIRKNLSASYKLVNDINMSTGVYNIEQGWNPIDDFNGTLDGNNHKIINLYINRPAQDNVGLFGYILNCDFTIQNLCIVNANVIGHDCVGALVGKVYVSHLVTRVVPIYYTNIYIFKVILQEIQM